MGDENELLASYEEAFRVFDNDGSGYISKNEFLECLKNLGNPMTEDEFAEMMKKLNKNVDDEISFEGKFYFQVESIRSEVESMIHD